MPNLAVTLRDEIRRLARKEVRPELDFARRASARHRRDIAQLKRLLQAQDRRIKALQSRLERLEGRPQAGAKGTVEGYRFSPRSVRSQRKRLHLSAEEYGRLIGVSAQTIYHWEQGKARPQKAQFQALVEVRGIGRREAARRLQEKGR